MRLKHVFLPQGPLNTHRRPMAGHDSRACARTLSQSVTQKSSGLLKGKVSPHASKGTHTSAECVRGSGDSG